MAERKKIVMLQDCSGSPDGRFVHLYKAGEEFILESARMSLELAKVFVNELKVAKAIKEVDGSEAGLEEIPAADAPAKPSKKVGPSETK